MKADAELKPGGEAGGAATRAGEDLHDPVGGGLAMCVVDLADRLQLVCEPLDCVGRVRRVDARIERRDA